MDVIVPAATLQPDTVRALDATGWPYRVVDVSGDDQAYGRLLRDTWRQSRTFCVVEQDIVVAPDTLDALAACPAPLCAFPYDQSGVGTGEPGTGLGCTKFGSALIQDMGDPWPFILARSDLQHPPGHWCRLDLWLRQALNRAGWGQHQHAPAVGHHRQAVGPSHGCHWMPGWERPWGSAA